MGANPTHIGVITEPRRKHVVTLVPAASFASGDVISAALHTLDCAALAVGMGMKVVGIKVWEKSPEGTQIKPSLRFHFYNVAITTLPALNAPFTIHNDDYLKHVGHHDVVTGDYVEFSDGSDADPDHAKLIKTIDPNLSPTLYTATVTNTLWMAVEIRETKDLTNTTLTIELDTLKV